MKPQLLIRDDAGPARVEFRPDRKERVVTQMLFPQSGPMTDATMCSLRRAAAIVAQIRRSGPLSLAGSSSFLEYAG